MWHGHDEARRVVDRDILLREERELTSWWPL